MPFFSHAADPTSWLYPLVSGILYAPTLLFAFITAITPWGLPVLVVAVLALFAWNLMKDPYVN